LLPRDLIGIVHGYIAYDCMLPENCALLTPSEQADFKQKADVDGDGDVEMRD